MVSKASVPTASPSADSVESQKILALQIENFQGIRFLEVDLDSDTVEVSGPNGSGKTSFLDAIQFMLGNAAGTNDEPVRIGADKCKVLGRLNGYVVTATQTAKGTRTIKITDADGKPIDMPPQTFLDLLRNERCFDVGEFYRLKPRDQAEEMRRVLGLSDVFAKLDADLADATDMRKQAGRDLDQVKGALSLLPEVEGPDDEQSSADLRAEHEAAIKQRAENGKQRAWLSDGYELAEVMSKEIGLLEQKIADLKAKRDSALAELDAARDEIRALVDPDVSAIEAKLGQIDGLNRIARQRKERKALIERREQITRKYEEQQRRIEDIGERRRKALKEANIPVKGLTFDDEGNLRVDGVLFSQVNRATQMLVSAHVAMRQAPHLRVMLFRDADVMQPPTIAMLRDLAHQYGFQLILEVAVAKAGEGQNIVLDEGRVLSSKTLAAAESKA